MYSLELLQKKKKPQGKGNAWKTKQEKISSNVSG